MKAKAIKALDPSSLAPRLYNQVAALLTQLETGENITMRERVQALIAVGRLIQLFDKRGESDERAGESVRKYESAFTPTTGPGRPARHARSDPEPDDWFEHADIDDGTKYDPN
jgi:hypothetical protein